MKEKQRTLVQAVQVSEALRVENNDMLRQLQVDAGDSTGGVGHINPCRGGRRDMRWCDRPLPPHRRDSR